MTAEVENLLDLTRDESEHLLAEHHFGRLAVVVGEQPLIFPIAYVWYDRSVVFRSIPGAKVAAFERPVAFEVDGIDARYHGGWSVLVIGRAEPVTDPATVSELDRLPIPHWLSITAPVWVRIRPTAITGRKIHTAGS